MQSMEKKRYMIMKYGKPDGLQKYSEWLASKTPVKKTFVKKTPVKKPPVKKVSKSTGVKRASKSSRTFGFLSFF